MFWRVRAELRDDRGNTFFPIYGLEKVVDNNSIYHSCRITYTRHSTTFEIHVEADDINKAEHRAGRQLEKIAAGLALSGVPCYIQMEWPDGIQKEEVDEDILVQCAEDEVDVLDDLDLVRGTRGSAKELIQMEDVDEWVRLLEEAQGKDLARLRYIKKAVRWAIIDKRTAFLYAVAVIESFFEDEFRDIFLKRRLGKENIIFLITDILSKCFDESMISTLRKIAEELESYTWVNAFRELCERINFYGREAQARTKEQLKQSLKYLEPRLSESEINRRVNVMFEEHKRFWEETPTELMRVRARVAHFGREIIPVTQGQLLVAVVLAKALTHKSILGELASISSM